MIILVISRFGFGGWISVLIASEHDLCIYLLLFNILATDPTNYKTSYVDCVVKQSIAPALVKAQSVRNMPYISSVHDNS